MHLTFVLKSALHFSKLAMKFLTAVQSFVKPQLFTQHYKSVSFKLLCHLYGTPTFKTNTLRLVSVEGQVKCLLLLYKWL